ncbi:FkbM family methyltransferase [Cellulomonas bogoriensis]|uniref:Methyltransferase FkbM n=1 Tax=Cellulomonas bogoriensis 69B4 = DSM 16987 TaxID=1386082 RepID=A0A0A0C1S8_9CELL|nr:FkbM family methyltransferase [Cellulomonas bogoriensis]KGM13324.1 methyltransferase FkbM [Cellulomonas bogoriensis 69B4 = DSM 16987]
MADYRKTWRGRRQSWFGLKRHVKRTLSLPGAHHLLRTVAPLVPNLRVGRLPAPSSVHEVTGYADNQRFVLIRPDRCEIAKELYWGKGRRPNPQDALALDTVVILSRTADVFVDVGAYTGVFTIASASANRRLTAHAFEIVPAVARTLDANVRRNGLEARVTIHPYGLGSPGTTMRVPSGDGGSALPSFYSASMTFDDGVDVEFHPLDELAGALHVDDEHGRSVVMKIDVEGAEDQVLRHGQHFLTTFQPDILCEVLHGVADGPTLTDLLAPHGYHYYLVRDRDLLPQPLLTPDPTHRDWLITTRTPEQLARLGLPVHGERTAPA